MLFHYWFCCNRYRSHKSRSGHLFWLPDTEILIFCLLEEILRIFRSMFGILLSSTVADIKIHSFLAYVKTEYYILFALGFFVL